MRFHYIMFNANYKIKDNFFLPFSDCLNILMETYLKIIKAFLFGQSQTRARRLSVSDNSNKMTIK